MLEVDGIAIRMKLEKLRMATRKVSKNSFCKRHFLCNFLPGFLEHKDTKSIDKTQDWTLNWTLNETHWHLLKKQKNKNYKKCQTSTFFSKNTKFVPRLIKNTLLLILFKLTLSSNWPLKWTLVLSRTWAVIKFFSQKRSA